MLAGFLLVPRVEGARRERALRPLDGCEIERLRREPFVSALRVKDAQDLVRARRAGMLGQM